MINWENMDGRMFEYLAEYKIDIEGRIQNPGKFEGELIYTPYFYGYFLDCGADNVIEDNNGEIIVASFDIMDEDIKIFPNIAEYKRFELYFSDNGFVGGTLKKD